MAFALPAVLGAAGVSAGTAATIGTIASIASTAFTVLGAVKGAQGAKAEGKAAQQAAEYNAKVSTNNAIIARRNAELSGQEGEAATGRQQAETRARVGAIKAQQAASGVDVNTGSAVDVRSSAAETGQLSAISLRSQAARKAYGYNQQATDYESQAILQRAEGQNARTAGNMNAQTTLLGGLADAGSGFASYLNSRNPLGSSSSGNDITEAY